MLKFTPLKNTLKLLLKKTTPIILSFQIAFGVQTLQWPKAHASIATIDKVLSAEHITDPAVRESLRDHQKIADQIYEKQIDLLPSEIVDPFNIKGQSLTVGAKTVELGDPTVTLPSVVVDSVELVSKDNALKIIGFKHGQAVAVQTISSIDPQAIITDKEKAIVVTKSGDIEVIDMAFIIEYAFKEPIPLFNAYKASARTPVFENRNALEGTFLTRGLRPFIESEIESADIYNKPALNKDILIPRDKEGHPEFTAGDVVLYEKVNGKRSLVAILNQKAILDVLTMGHTVLATAGTLFSIEGLKNTFPEKLQSYLQVDFEGQLNEPIHDILAFIESYANAEAEVQRLQSQVNKMTMDEDLLVKRFFASFDQKKMRDLVSRVKKFEGQKQSKHDQFTLLQWAGTYEKINSQSKSIISELESRAKAADIQDAERIQQDINGIKAQQTSEDYRQDYSEILKSYITGNTGFHQLSGTLLDKLRSRSVKTFGKVVLALSAAGLTAWAGGRALEGFSPTIAHEYYFTINNLWDTYASEVLKDSEFRWAAIRGGTYLMALIPLTMLYGYAIVPILKRVQNMYDLAVINKQVSGPLSQKIHNSLKRIINKYEDISVMQRIITISAFPYAVLIKPYMNTALETFLSQPTVRVWKAGLNPFKNIKANSVIGQKLNLQPGQSTYLGFTNLLKVYSKDKSIKINELALKDKALRVSTNEKTITRSLAFKLAAFAVYYENNIDPATLFALVTNEMSLKQLQEIQKSPELQKKWRRTAFAVRHEIQRIINSQGKDIDKLDINDLESFYEIAKQKAEQVQSNPKLKNIILDLKNKFTLLGSNTAKAWGYFGVEENNFLRSKTANKYVADQTFREFWQDHTMVVGVPILGGVRSEVGKLLAENKPHQIVHNPDFFLDTPPPHLTDVTNNTLIHLVMAGPRRMLVMQKTVPVSEGNYTPIEQQQISAANRTEGFFKGAYSWTANVLKFHKTNLGGYYLKGFVRRFNTVQAGITLAVLMRWSLGGQSMEAAWMAGWFSWVAAELYFAWPWMIIDVGNSSEEGRVGVYRGQHETIIQNILKGFRDHDEALVEKSFDDLTRLYQKSGRMALTPVYNMIRQSEKGLNINEDRLNRKDIIKALMDPARKEILGVAGKMYKALEANDDKGLRASYEQLEAVVYKQLDARQLIRQDSSFAKNLADYSLMHSPVFNTPNSTVANVTTFGLGALLTTYLGIELSYDSYEPENLNIETIAKWGAFSLAFYGILYTTMSKYMWENYYLKPFDKIRSGIKKAKVKTFSRPSRGQSSQNSCRVLFSH